MTSISLIPAAACHLAAARALYEGAFPPEERRPWQSIVEPLSEVGPRLHIISLADGSAAGFVTVWLFDRFIYVEHLAVDPAVRGGGIGALTLAELEKIYGLPIALEVEPPADDNPMAIRRIGFYRRCGLEVLDFDYIQPPYSENLPSVPLLLMATPGAPEPSEIAERLHKEVYGVSI